MAANQDDLERLIRDIYQGAIEDEALEPALRGVMALVGASKGWVNAFAPLDTIALIPGVNMNPDIHSRYVEYYRLVDPWALKVLRAATPGVATSTERHVPTQEFLASEVYNDLIVPTGSDIAHNLAMISPFGENLAAISLMRGPRAEPFGEAEERLLDIVGPHLMRMLKIRHEADASRGRWAGFTTGVSGHCLFTLDGDGRLRDVNQAGASMLASSSLVRVALDQRLVWWHATEAQLADRLIGRAAGLGIGGTLTLHDREGVSYHMILDVARARPFGDGASLLVTIVNVPVLVESKTRVASRLFSLSPSEVALAKSLMLGRTVEDHADRRGSSRETVRKQLAGLFRKTGVSRQAALVALLFSLPDGTFD